MTQNVTGLHHITAFAGDPAKNHAFYTDILGLRMVKKTVNYDDPSTYHLYYADKVGTPGTLLTFFPWPQAEAGHEGLGQAVGTRSYIPKGSFSFWLNRLSEKTTKTPTVETLFGEKVISFKDPDGMALELVETAENFGNDVWVDGSIGAEHAIIGFAGQTLWIGRGQDSTLRILTEVFGYKQIAEENGRVRLEAQSNTTAKAMARFIDIAKPTGSAFGREGPGVIHHIAFRASDDAHQAELVTKLAQLGHHMTEQVDRNYFRSVYFRTPSGILFEIATDAPGMSVDESVDELGGKLLLPPWYEPKRRDIEAVLPPLAA